jgi:hypothetical protein
MSDVGWARDIADMAMNEGGYSYIEREALRVIAAARAAEREECRKIAKGFWLHYPFDRIADADLMCALSEGIADAILARSEG